MNQNPSPGIFIVPYEVFRLLDPIERLVIKSQAERGEVVITESSEASR